MTKTPIDCYRDSIEMLIASELQTAFAKLKGRRNSALLRRTVRQEAQNVLKKYRDAGLPVHHVRGLLDTSTQRFHVAVEQVPMQSPNGVRELCSVCDGAIKLPTPVYRGLSLCCGHCRGSGLEPQPLARVYDLERFRSMRR